MSKQKFNSLRINVVSNNFIRSSNSILSSLGSSSERKLTDFSELRSTEIHNMSANSCLTSETLKEPPLVCQKMFQENSLLERSLLIHNKEKLHICGLCNKKFLKKSGLKSHMVTHTGEQPHKCNICNKKFGRKENLTKHIVIHTGEKPYECKNCKKRFSQKVILTRHIVTHSGKQPHKCNICNKKFSQKRYLNRHLETHSREKNFHCETCNKSFSTRSYLKKHTKSLSHSEKEHIANSKLNSKFTQEQNMNQHINMHLEKDNIHNSMRGETFLETFKHGVAGPLTSNKNCNSEAQNSNITKRKNASFQTTLSSHTNSNSQFSKQVNRNWNLDGSQLDLSKRGMKHSLSENKTNNSQLHNISTQLATASSGIDIKNQSYNFSSTYIPPHLTRQSPIYGMKNVQTFENKLCQPNSNSSTTRQQSKSISHSELYSLPFRKRYLRQHSQHTNCVNVPECLQPPLYDHSYYPGNFQSQSELSSCNDTSKLDNSFSQLCLVDSGPMNHHHLSQQQREVKPSYRMPKKAPYSNFH